MSMFETYENLPIDYMPDNSSPTVEQLTLDTNELPKREYNAKGEFIGYTWNHGETFDLTFSVKQVIRVKSDSILYALKGAQPDILTPGYVGQKAYNTADKKSWTCRSIYSNAFIWVEDEKLTYSSQGDAEIDLTPDMRHRSLQLQLLNFRRELISTLSNTGAIDICLSVDKDITEQLKPGVYHCIFSEIDGSNMRVISETTFYVK